MKFSSGVAWSALLCERYFLDVKTQTLYASLRSVCMMIDRKTCVLLLVGFARYESCTVHQVGKFTCDERIQPTIRPPSVYLLTRQTGKVSQQALQEEKKSSRNQEQKKDTVRGQEFRHRSMYHH